jgi:hypothetical protein
LLANAIGQPDTKAVTTEKELSLNAN